MPISKNHQQISPQKSKKNPKKTRKKNQSKGQPHASIREIQQ